MEQSGPVMRRIRYLDVATLEDSSAAGLLHRTAELGFDAILVPSNALAEGDALKDLTRAAAAASLQVLADVVLAPFPADHALVAAHPNAFSIRRQGTGEGVVDPRRPAPLAGEARARLDDPASLDVVFDFLAEEIARWAAAGVGGVRLAKPDAAPPSGWRRLIQAVRAKAPGFVFIAEGQSAPRASMLALAGCGLDAVTSSLPHWDGRSRWFVEEYEALRSVAPVISSVAPRTRSPETAEADERALEAQLMLAAATGSGLLVRLGDEFRLSEDGVEQALRGANALAQELAPLDGELRMLTGEGAAVTALLRVDSPDVRRCTHGLLVLVNPSAEEPAEPLAANLLSAAGAEFGPFERLGGSGESFAPLRPSEVRLLLARRSQPIARSLPAGGASAQAAGLEPRLVVEEVSPRVEGGPYPVRRVVGETVEVEADIFADGHEQLSGEVQWRALDEAGWSAAPMQEVGNDRWRARFPLERLGRYEFVVEGWLDIYAGFRRDYRKKRDAGVAQAVDVQEGVEFVKAAGRRAKGPLKAELKAVTDRLKGAGDDAARGQILLEEPLAALMRQADERPFSRRSEPQIVDAERLQARFASWYEVFPRSQTVDPARHGTFDDVVARLPWIRAMGFDVLYFPPIHPIGRKNMKGRNNTLTPSEDDVGSPYAIGSAAGGHDAIHPELGSFEDFRRLVQAAAAQGLEIALDFAVQCSPDHPWLKEHPGWFDWRPDGSIKYAENPPKKYQDIVNVDFYKPDAIPDLWLALRDIVLLWVGEGVRLFRVDNPHTKPLPFWEWMIGEVRSAHPDVVFLAEAFTRPKVMYRLAKIGFSQSYTYFTWRHTKTEFIDYLTELTQDAPKEFFRPHFFVNTPDINPVFLQTSGRAGFLIRAALAATLSGLFGVYQGFELCEFEPLAHGKEEYKDSEKYEIRVRPDRAPGDIVDEITRLNRIRKGHPALQTHLGIDFLPGWNEQVLVFAKATPGRDDVVVVAISLDPHHAQETQFELPLWRWGLSDDAGIEVEDLVWDSRYIWHGRGHHVRLEPNAPYAIWSLKLPRAAA